MALSHDDRHYRPDTRHSSGSARRYEGNGDSDGRQNRHHPGTNERSPERRRDHSRSLSPQGRESRVHGNQRPPRRGNKPDGPQKESTTDVPKNDNRPSVPSSATQHFAKSVRRQLNRAQNQSKDDHAVDTQSGELSHVIQHKEASSKGHNRNRDHTHASDHTNDTTNSTLSTLLSLFLRICGTDTCVVILEAILPPHCLVCFALLTLGHFIGFPRPRHPFFQILSVRF